MVNVHIPSLFHLLLSWGLVEPFQPRFIYPCEFISASFLSNVVSKWSQYFFLYFSTVVCADCCAFVHGSCCCLEIAPKEDLVFWKLTDTDPILI